MAWQNSGANGGIGGGGGDGANHAGQHQGTDYTLQGMSSRHPSIFQTRKTPGELKSLNLRLTAVHT